MALWRKRANARVKAMTTNTQDPVAFVNHVNQHRGQLIGEWLLMPARSTTLHFILLKLHFIISCNLR